MFRFLLSACVVLNSDCQLVGTNHICRACLINFVRAGVRCGGAGRGGRRDAQAAVGDRAGRLQLHPAGRDRPLAAPDVGMASFAYPSGARLNGARHTRHIVCFNWPCVLLLATKYTNYRLIMNHVFGSSVPTYFAEQR
jgi:hypothetical protein